MPEKFYWGGGGWNQWRSETICAVYNAKYIMCILKLLLWGKVLLSRPIWTLTYKDLPASTFKSCATMPNVLTVLLLFILLSFVLFSFMSTWHKLPSPGKKDHNQGNVSIGFPDRQVCKTFSWLMFDEGWPSSLWTSLGRQSWMCIQSRANKPVKGTPL